MGYPKLSEEQATAAARAMLACGFTHWRGDITEEECINDIWEAICASSPRALVVQEAKNWTRKFLWGWQDSPMSPDDAADIIVNHIIESLTTGSNSGRDCKKCDADPRNGTIDFVVLHAELPKKCA